MFTSDPWTDYTIALSALLTGYYLFVMIKFYRSDLKSLIGSIDRPSVIVAGPEALQQKAVASLNESSSELDSLQPEALIPFKQLLSERLEELTGHLKELIMEAHQKRYSSQDLMILLQMTLREYPTITGSPFQRMINNLIDSECAKYGSMHLNAQDKVMIWKSV